MLYSQDTRPSPGHARDGHLHREDPFGHRRFCGAELAARATVDLADSTASELHVIHVGVVPNFLIKDPAAVGYDCKLYEELERESREVLRKLTWRVKVAGGTVAHLRMGRPDQEIVELGASMIVMGSRGHGGLRRVLRRSVSDQVIRHAPCPVLVVRPEKDARETAPSLRKSSIARYETPNKLSARRRVRRAVLPRSRKVETTS